MMGSDVWRRNWRVVSPPGAVSVPVPFAGGARLSESVRKLPAGTAVVMFADAPAAILRCRRLAARAGVQLEREYLAFPSGRAPGYLVEDAAAPVRTFLTTVAATPPGGARSTAADVVLRLLRACRSWRLVRALAPGRVVVGWRS